MSFYLLNLSSYLLLPWYRVLRYVGLTPVPGLPAKAIIDIDVVVLDINNESTYACALESQGFQFMFREPKSHSHRFFTTTEPMFANVHVWGLACLETETPHFQEVVDTKRRG
jgi:GrpB-like predicted nucleotidyltransferase (UPF0157 family)